MPLAALTGLTQKSCSKAKAFQVKLSTSLFLLGEGMASGREAKAPWLTRFSLSVATCDKRRKRLCASEIFRGLDSAAALLSRRTPSSSKAATST